MAVELPLPHEQEKICYFYRLGREKVGVVGTSQQSDFNPNVSWLQWHKVFSSLLLEKTDIVCFGVHHDISNVW